MILPCKSYLRIKLSWIFSNGFHIQHLCQSLSVGFFVYFHKGLFHFLPNTFFQKSLFGSTKLECVRFQVNLQLDLLITKTNHAVRLSTKVPQPDMLVVKLKIEKIGMKELSDIIKIHLIENYQLCITFCKRLYCVNRVRYRKFSFRYRESVSVTMNLRLLLS